MYIFNLPSNVAVTFVLGSFNQIFIDRQAARKKPYNTGHTCTSYARAEIMQINWTVSSEFGTYRLCEQQSSGKPAHLRSLARTSTARSYKQRVKRNLQTESQILGPSEWLGMGS